MAVFSLASSQTLTLKFECRKLRHDRSLFFSGVCSSLCKKPILSPTLALNLKAPKKEKSLMTKGKMGDSAFQSGKEWVLNSGARMHFTPEIDDFVNYMDLKKPVELWLPNGRWLMGSVVGDVAISPELTLKDVLYVGGFDEDRTLSVGALMETSDDLTIALDSGGCSFAKRLTGQLLATGLRDETGLYTITSPPRLATRGSPLNWINGIPSPVLHGPTLNRRPSKEKWPFRANPLVHSGDPEQVEWLFDSASVSHWTWDPTILGNEIASVNTAGEWSSSGQVSLMGVGVLLANVQVKPSLDANLLSLGSLCDTQDVAFHFVGDRCMILDGASGEQIGAATKNKENLYALKCWVLPG